MESIQQLYATAGGWLEQNAIDQLQQVSALPDVVRTVAFPDIHAGKGSPIGIALATLQTIYPHIVGNDIGCGIALYATDLELRSFKRDRAWRRFDRFAEFSDIPLDDQSGGSAAVSGLGTIGGGNHFAEFTALENIDDPQRLAELGLQVGQVGMLVHSGSRGLGEAILRHGIAAWSAQLGFAADSPGGLWYREEHQKACGWAKLNRRLIARRCLVGLGVKDSSRCLLDVVHNCLESYGQSTNCRWVHRKGAAKADAGLVLIPGSRGSLSYLVSPLRPNAENLFSLAHGAGRKWQRGATRGKLGAKYNPESIYRTALGSRVLCRDRDLVFEEAPEAYKNIDRVIADLVAFGLIKVVASFRPILTLKY